MNTRTIICSDTAPAAIGPYSQAVAVGNVVYCSGQIPLHPVTLQIVDGGIEAQTRQVFDNLRAVAVAAGGSLADFVKINIYLIDLAEFATVNAIMAEYFVAPFPARACVQVSALPKAALVEVEGTLVVGGA